MTKPTLIWHRFNDRDTFTSHLTDTIAAELNSITQSQDIALFGVSGGSTPIPVYKKLTKQTLAWPNIHFVIVDERYVPSIHADSNEKNIRDALSNSPLAEKHVIGLWSEAASIDEAALRANHTLEALHRPLDMVLLGMGEDGHFASLFPTGAQFEQAISTDTTRIIFPIEPMPEHAPHSRLSMSLSYLRQSKRIILAITGDKKRRVLEQALADGNALDLPIAALLHSDCPAIEIFWSE